MKRLFCAVKVQPNTEILDVIHHFREGLIGERIKWVNPDNLHLTLKFFGDTQSENETEIINAFRHAGKHVNNFSFELSGIGFFGSHRLPRVLWIGIKQPEALQLLYKEVNKYLKPLGYLPDKPQFVPHLTVARIKELKNTNAFHRLIIKHQNDRFGEQHIKSFELYQSILRPQGPEYRIVKAFDLQL